MEIKLTNEESEKYFYNSLCNGAQISYYGLTIDYTRKAYDKAKKTLKDSRKFGEEDKSICFEDVLMQVLRQGDKLKVVDNEGEGDYTRSITIKEVHERVQKTPIRHLMNAINEEDDGDTADVILQSVFFEDIIFG